MLANVPIILFKTFPTVIYVNKIRTVIIFTDKWKIIIDCSADNFL